MARRKKLFGGGRSQSKALCVCESSIRLCFVTYEEEYEWNTLYAAHNNQMSFLNKASSWNIDVRAANDVLQYSKIDSKLVTQATS